MLAAVGLEGRTNQLLRALADVEQLCLFLDNVGQHSEQHGQTARCQAAFHVLEHFITDAGQLVLTDTRHLRNRNLLILHLEILEIHVEQLVHRAIEQTRAGTEHFCCILLDVQTGDLRQLFCSHAIKRRTRRRAEHQRVRQDCRAQQTRDFRLDLHVVLMVHLRDDGRGAAERLIAEVDRSAGLHRVNAVVVDDLNNIGRTNTFGGLIALVVINQNDRRTLQIQQVTL